MENSYDSEDAEYDIETDFQVKEDEEYEKTASKWKKWQLVIK